MSDDKVNGKRLEIANKAKELAIKYKSSSYSQTGRSTTAMDCSYFVYLVFHEVFPEYKYLNTVGIASSAAFTVSAQPKVGDIIFFEKGKVPHEVAKKNEKEFPNHVGIVIDNSSWVGRQTSKLGVVGFNDIWWWPRGPKFYSYCQLDEAFVATSAAAIRHWIA